MPIADIFGSHTCQLYFYCITLYFHSVLMGGFMMAFYRFPIVLFPRFSVIKVGKYKIINACIATQIVYSIAHNLFTHNSLGAKLTPSKEFCFGYSPMMSEMIRGMSLEDKEELSFGVIFGLILASAMVTLEVLIYAVLMRELYKQNKESSRKGILPKNVFQARNKTNVITLTGKECNL